MRGPDLRRLVDLERLSGADFIPGPDSERPQEDDFERFRRQVLQCTRCPLCRARRNVVFGSGPLDARIMLVGEGPGEEEDLTGEPFVGRAGRLLTRVLEGLGVRRDSVYITNIVKCRPPANRKPELEEIRACIPYLLRQIARIRPKLVVALGAVAAGALLNRQGISVLRERGRIVRTGSLNVFLTVHPSYCLRNPPETRLLEEDLRRAFLLAAPLT